jgi:hypothetical protein
MAASSAPPDGPKASIHGANPVIEEERKVLFDGASLITNKELLMKLRVRRRSMPESK